MPGISPKLPLTLNKSDVSYTLNKDLKQTVQQNLKNLILTNPGERVMDSRFGVGLKKFLFENFSETLTLSISSEIKKQVSRYMSFIKINDIVINDDQDSNKIYITVKYSVPSLSIQNILSLDIARNN